MKITDLTFHPEIISILTGLKNDQLDKKTVSDIIDNEGHQYVDLVQEGGGILGIALTGYTYILEEIGIRFLGLAGTSAGAINAMLLAALGKLSEAKSEKIITALLSKNLFDFVDGDSDVKDLIKTGLDHPKVVKMVWKFLQVIDDLKEDFGLNPGNDFLQWMSTLLKNEGIENYASLVNRLAELPKGLHVRPGIENRNREIKAKLALITSEIITESKIEFPAMAELFWNDVGGIDPALFVRSSMSIPFFFDPVVVSNLPSGEKAQVRFRKKTGFKGQVPEKAYFVDGGIMSNFPIQVFHSPGVPRKPTFGVKLGYDRLEANHNKTVFNYMWNIFNSARHVFDFDFLLRHPDYKNVISRIDIGNHNWLNFNIDDQGKTDLFLRGARAANDFIRGFNWEEYKTIRQRLMLAD